MHSRNRILLLSIAFSAACEPGRQPAQEEIPILAAAPAGSECSKPIQQSADSILDLNEISGYPCELIAVPTGIALRPSVDGAHPDPEVGPLTQIAKDSRGRFFTTARRDRRILVWSADGTFLRTIGKEGAGPGEFAGRVRALFVDAGDSLHALDASGRWIVFDPEQRFVRMFSTGARGLRSSHLAGDGTIVQTGPMAGAERGKLVHVLGPDGRMQRSFGVPRAGRARDATEMRPSAVGTQGDVWIAPAPGSGEGYVIERWSRDGRLLQLIRRDVPWLPLTGYSDEPRAPDFKFLHVDGDGLLWVGVVVKDERWSESRPGEHPDAREAEQADIRIEVIDPRAGRVLASVRYDYFTESSLPPIYPVGRWNREVWGSSVDSNGLASIHLARLHLVPWTASPRTARAAASASSGSAGGSEVLAALGCVVGIGGPRCASPREGGPLTPEELATLEIPAVMTTASELESATRLALADAPDFNIDGPVDSAGMQAHGIRFMTTLHDGSIAVVRRGGRVILHDRDGAPRDTIELPDAGGKRAHAEAIFDGGGDTLVVARDDPPTLRILRDGTVIDSIEHPRYAAGMPGDGTLILRTHASQFRRRTGRGAEFFPTRIDALPRERFSPTDYGGGRLFEGGYDVFQSLPTPWSRYTRLAAGGGALWISPTSGPELIRMNANGDVTRRIQWEVRDTALRPAELVGWREAQTRRARSWVHDTAEVERRLAEVREVNPDRAARAIDRLLAGPDGSVWVRERVALGATSDSVSWIGFDSTGTLIGRLVLPEDVNVAELSASHALIQRRDDWARASRVRLIASPDL